jgi:hypothetical protein
VKKRRLANVTKLDELIREIRGQKVMLDFDLARIYGVPTKALNQAVKRNRDRFPADFLFQLSGKEWKDLRCQFGTSSSKPGSMRSQIVTASRRNIRARPYAFTEHGAIMAANVLNSRRAVADEYDVRGRRWIDCIVRLGNGRAIGRARVSVFVVRAFLKMRVLLGDKRELAQKLASLEKELKKRLDVHEAVIVTILQRVMDIIDPPALPSSPPKPRIGFTL